MIFEVMMKLPNATWDIPALYRGVYFDTRAEAEAHIAELVASGERREDCTIATREARPVERKPRIQFARRRTAVRSVVNALPEGNEIPLPELDEYFL